MKIKLNELRKMVRNVLSEMKPPKFPFDASAEFTDSSGNNIKFTAELYSWDEMGEVKELLVNGKDMLDIYNIDLEEIETLALAKMKKDNDNAMEDQAAQNYESKRISKDRNY